ncbi:glycosyltransferase [Rhodopirellula baltica]
MLRMASWLLKHGHQVSILTAQGGFLEDSIPEKAENTIVGSSDFGACIIPFWKYPDQVVQAIKEADVVFSMSGGGCTFAYHLMRRFSPNGVLLAGVFHPNTGTTESQKHYFDHVFQHCVHDSNKVYMNEAIREIHRHRTGKLFEQSRLWALPIDPTDNKMEGGKINSSTILSVGRLTRFKGYNWYMPDVIKALLDAGMEARWRVIGDDEPDTREGFKQEIIDKCEALGVLDQCEFIGIVPFEKLGDEFTNAKAFVGMGTSLLAAAASGLPSIVALCDDTEGRTYGFPWEQPIGCVGEWIPSIQPERNVHSLLQEILTANRQDYASLQEKSKVAVTQHDLDLQMEKFLGLCQSAKRGFTTYCPPTNRFILSKTLRFGGKRLASLIANRSTPAPTSHSLPNQVGS